MKSLKQYFTEKLLLWNLRENVRQMPWKGELDPYKIWLSEIILQQTRVEQGWSYYNRFIDRFPKIEDLARAPEKAIFKLWEGLGYYTRCKNLIATAKFIAKEKKGKFPSRYEDILALKGVGPYTAAAIASFAFNLPHAVLDGNVFRVLSRFFGIETEIDSAEGKKEFTKLAMELLDTNAPGNYNQALMDLGAVVCKPKNPICSACPLKNKCQARHLEKILLLPVKSAPLVKRSRYFYYFVIAYKNSVYVRKRGPKDIWENLHEFVLAETEGLQTLTALKDPAYVQKLSGVKKLEVLQISELYKQQLSHQTIQGRFIQCRAANPISLKDYKTTTYTQLSRLAFPGFINRFLAENEPVAFAG